MSLGAYPIHQEDPMVGTPQSTHEPISWPFGRANELNRPLVTTDHDFLVLTRQLLDRGQSIYDTLPELLELRERSSR